MGLTKANLRDRTKQLLGNRTSTALDNDWYDERVLNGYRRLVTFQGYVTGPGRTQPQFRVLRFPILENRVTQSLTSSMTENFQALQSGYIAILDVYNRTDNVGLSRAGQQNIRNRDPDETGPPVEWEPGAKDEVRGYYIWPYPGSSDDDKDVYEYCVKDVSLASDSTEPVIDDEWHMAIAYAAAVEGATLLDWQDKAEEMDAKLRAYIAERITLDERQSFAGQAGPRRSVEVGTW